MLIALFGHAAYSAEVLAVMRSRAKQKLQFEGMFSVDHADLAHIFFRAHHSPNLCSVEHDHRNVGDLREQNLSRLVC